MAMVFVATCTSGALAQEEHVVDLNNGEKIDMGNGQTLHLPPKPEPATSARADIGDPDEAAGGAPRTNIKDADSLHRMIQGVDGNGNEEREAIVGFFEQDEDGGVKGREDENSAYQLFRKASIKNAKVPFAKIVSSDLAGKFGVTELPAIVYMAIPEGADAVHLRRAQFFDDLQLYKNDDPNRIFGTYTAAGYKAWGPEQALKMLRSQM
jgi:hypothetical protein